MQRAAAVQQQSKQDEDEQPVESKGNAPSSKQAKPDEEAVKASTAATPAIATSIDGNEEHWSFAPSTSRAAATLDEDQHAQGWDSWLLSSSSGSSSSGGASKSSVGQTGTARRKFGRFQEEEDPEQEEDEEDTEQQQGRNRGGRGPRASGASSSSAGKRRKRDDEDGLEPDFDQDTSSSRHSGPVTMRDKKAKQDKGSKKAKKAAAEGNEGFRKPKSFKDEEDDASLEANLLDESFADQDYGDDLEEDEGAGSTTATGSKKQKRSRRKKNKGKTAGA